MEKSLFRIKLNWLAFFLAFFGVIYLAVYYFTGSNYQAYRTCLFVFSFLITPIVVIFTHEENTDKPLRNSKENYEEPKEQEETQQINSQHSYKYVYGSRYEDLHVHF